MVTETQKNDLIKGKTIIVETDKDSIASFKARTSDESVIFVSNLELASGLLTMDKNIKQVLCKLKSYKDKDFTKDTDKKILLDSIWNRRDLLDVIGKATENKAIVGILIENHGTDFHKYLGKLSERFANITTFKDMSVTVRTNGLKDVVKDAFDGGHGDISIEDKEKMLKDGVLTLVTDWPDYTDKMNKSVTKTNNHEEAVKTTINPCR
jgi:hypothetical protein